MHAQSKTIGCWKFLSVKNNWKFKKQKKFCLQSKNFPPDKRHPGHRSRYGKYRPRSGYGFLRTACQPIRIENFEKPYNNKGLFTEHEVCTVKYQTEVF